MYSRADALLKGTQDAEEVARLRECARMVIHRLSGGEKGVTLYGAIYELEARLIEQALEEEEGIVTRAAKRLGVAHQTLISLLKTRHKRLLDKRTPAKRRLWSIIKKGL